jgi:hypothetical protein
MKIIFRLAFIFAILFIFVLPRIEHFYDLANSENKAKYISTAEIIKHNEMYLLLGGVCGGGKCEVYINEEGCEPDCTVYEADECKGTEGDCENNCSALLCYCPTYNDWLLNACVEFEW